MHQSCRLRSGFSLRNVVIVPASTLRHPSDRVLKSFDVSSTSFITANTLSKLLWLECL